MKKDSYIAAIEHLMQGNPDDAMHTLRTIDVCFTPDSPEVQLVNLIARLSSEELTSEHVLTLLEAADESSFTDLDKLLKLLVDTSNEATPKIGLLAFAISINDDKNYDDLINLMIETLSPEQLDPEPRHIEGQVMRAMRVMRPLTCAIFKDREDIMTKLLDKGLDPNKTSLEPNDERKLATPTPIMSALKWREHPTADQLLDRGARLREDNPYSTDYLEEQRTAPGATGTISRQLFIKTLDGDTANVTLELNQKDITATRTIAPRHGRPQAVTAYALEKNVKAAIHRMRTQIAQQRPDLAEIEFPEVNDTEFLNSIIFQKTTEVIGVYKAADSVSEKQQFRAFSKWYDAQEETPSQEKTEAQVINVFCNGMGSKLPAFKAKLSNPPKALGLGYFLSDAKKRAATALKQLSKDVPCAPDAFAGSCCGLFKKPIQTNPEMDQAESPTHTAATPAI